MRHGYVYVRRRQQLPCFETLKTEGMDVFHACTSRARRPVRSDPFPRGTRTHRFYRTAAYADLCDSAGGMRARAYAPDFSVIWASTVNR